MLEYIFNKGEKAYMQHLKFDNYDLKQYEDDIIKYGLKEVWSDICKYVLSSNYINDGLLNFENIGELYEIGLAINDKNDKKKSGQYYTPKDVALVMAQWFDNINGNKICDVGCGTGNLILTYFEYIGAKRTREILENGLLYLYDLDENALLITKTIIQYKYGVKNELVNAIVCDFLDKNIIIPENSKVIMNPPYSKITQIGDNWGTTEVITDTNELYAAFIEKVIIQSKSSVIITPYSYISSNKFYSLRKILNNYNGFIVAFDNVPGNIFNGRKKGIFNTNTSNSVRAAITVVENKKNVKGFKVSPLIRFKNEEREKLLKCDVLEKTLYQKYQILDSKNKMYYKCFNDLGQVYENWEIESDKRFKDCIAKEGKYRLHIPNTCRYVTTGTKYELQRGGQYIFNFNDEKIYDFCYCLINSSFAYFYWRLYDGGITFQKSLLESMPIFYNKLSNGDIEYFSNIAKDMIRNEKKYIVTKNNVGIQENVRFPQDYIDNINNRLLKVLKVNGDSRIFDEIHKNKFF